MKKVCFLVPKDVQSPIGFKLFLEHNYGQTDVVEWEILYDNSVRLYEQIETIEKKFSAIYQINQVKEIVSRSEDDFIILSSKNIKLIDNCKFLQCKNIQIEGKTEDDKGKKNQIINIYYQKTFDFDYDYDRLLTDFENIINQEVVYEASAKISKIDYSSV